SVSALTGTADAADPELGGKVYAQKCAACHGPDGKGNAKMEQALKVKIPALADAAAKPDSELTKIVSEGKKPMPGFGKSLSKAELAAVVHYTKALAAGKAVGVK
ncbi:MAG: cytochrome c, partial [Candidatus Rokubacteria bacterium]|nr:cytochrome c [Candidatus Rokubacteria bacterium]